MKCYEYTFIATWIKNNPEAVSREIGEVGHTTAQAHSPPGR